jgi:SAM-dependent methyltransferase
MPGDVYLHGFSDRERRRLVRQAQYWRDSLIPLGLDYRPGDRVLEIGCAAGATLGVLAARFPGIAVAGIDLERGQIDFAHSHLRSLGVTGADLRVGDAADLPWESGRFDHVYIMWLLEHLHDSAPVLREAHRVLRGGGDIAVTETDYTTFKLWPPSSDWDYLEATQLGFFQRHGDPVAGRRLGALLHDAGFARVRNAPVGFHFFRGDDATGLRAHAAYVADFLEPAIETMAGEGADPHRLRRGVAVLRSIADRAGSAMTQIVYRAHAVKRAEGPADAADAPAGRGLPDSVGGERPV